MKILGIETTGPFCSAAILDGEDIDERVSEEKLNHLKSLTPMIDELMRVGGHKLTDMDAIAVSAGPGSFTGIRIGVSTGRALNQVSGVPLISVPTLFAFGCSEYEANKEGIVCPLFNARRGQVYAGAYSDFCEIIPGGPYMLDEFIGMLKEIGESRAASDGADSFAVAAGDGEDSSGAAAAAKALGKVLFIGDGVDAYADKIEELCAGMDYEMKSVYQDAAGVCEMAADMLADPETFAGRLGLSYNDLKPEYMRITEAEQRLKDGTLGKGIAGKSNG